LAAALVVWTATAATCLAQDGAKEVIEAVVEKAIPVKVEEAAEAPADEKDDQTGIPCLILKPDGTPLADTEVKMVIISQRTSDNRGVWSKSLRTDAEGRLFVKVGESKVWLEGSVEKVGAFASEAIVVTKGAATAEQKLQLNVGGRITGRVVNQADGQPLKGAKVSYQHHKPGKSRQITGSPAVTTDAEGRFTLENVPSQGQIVVSASLDGYQNNQTAVAVAEGQATENVEIKLIRLGVLRCRLLKSDGTPAANVRVRVVSRTESDNGRGRSNSSSDLTTDADGAVEVKSLRPGTVRLLFYVANVGYGRPDAITIVKGQEIAPLTVTLKPLLTASGTVVVKQTGQAVPEARIQLYPSHNGSDEWPSLDMHRDDIKADAEGRWTAANLAPGNYYVQASREGYNGLNQEIEVSDGQDLKDVKLELLGKVTVTGTVTSRDTGEAVAKAKVACGGAEGVTDDQGKFSLQVTPNEGNMYLSVTADGLAVYSQEVTFPDYRAPAPLRIAMEPGGIINGQVIDQDARRPAANREVIVASVTKCQSLKFFLQNRQQMNDLHAGYLQDGGQGSVLRATTDAQGGFTITTAPPDKYVVILFPDDAPPIIGEPFDLAAGGTIDVPAIQVTARPAGYVSGRLLGPDGKPLTGAHVRFSGSDRNHNWTRSTQLRGGRYFVPLSPSGVTRFFVSAQGYAPVERTIRTPDGNVAVEEDVTLTPVKSDASISGRVFLADGTTPAAGVGVQLYVRDGHWFGNTYGSWQSNNQVVTLAEEPVLTEADGTFRISNLPPGKYGLMFDPRGKRRPWGGDDEKPQGGLAGYRMSRRDGIEVAESAQVADINVTLEKSGAIAGQVLDAATGQPIAGAYVNISPLNSRTPAADDGFWPWGQQNMSTQTDENGKFLLDGLAAGSYYVYAWANGYARETAGFWGRKATVVKVGETAQRTVRLKSR